MSFRSPEQNAPGKFLLFSCISFLFAYICPVKKTLAVFLAVLLLSVNATFGEVLHLPTLIHHYLEHADLDGQTSVAGFIAMHYADRINHPDDHHHDHQRLPFKSTDCHLTATLGVLFPYAPVMERMMPEAISRTGITMRPQHYANAYLHSIWQPPRFS